MTSPKSQTFLFEEKEIPNNLDLNHPATAAWAMEHYGAFKVAAALARRNHPQESKTAAQQIAPKLPEMQLDVLHIVRRNPDMTTNELAKLYGHRDPRTIGRRLPELAAQGRIYKSGSRRCTVTGRTAATWKETSR